MEEENLHTSINTYKQQLSQVEQAIQAAGSTPDLEALRNDLQELINLTEGSLLSLKKSNLLKQLDVADQGRELRGSDITSTQKIGLRAGEDNLDDEYSAFQAMLGDELSENASENKEKKPSYSEMEKRDNSFDSTRADNPSSSNCPMQMMSDMYNEIVGTRCRAPYRPDWGAKVYGNALISGVENDSNLEIPKVRVMFCNPTETSMLPCKYYLEGSCRFAEEECRYSHGHIVSLEDLQEYQDPDYNGLKLESRCLARYDEDDLWYKATVVDLHDDGASVTFDEYNDEPVSLPFVDILPQDALEASSDSDDDITDNQPISRQDSDEDDELPVFLWKPPSHGLGDLGQWEAHTKGIGSKLLTKMGYVPGQGLGKAGEGRIQPVPIQLLPQGKSLDKIMALKQIAGNRDMFDVMKKEEKKKKKHAEKLEKQYHKAKELPNVFDFINKKLHGKKGKLSELIHKHEGHGHQGSDRGQGHGRMHRTISEQDLKSKSDRNLNIQLLKTSEEMRSVEKELVKLRQALSRNESRDRNMTSQLRQKIQGLEGYLDRLKSSESAMQSHQQKRSDHKKLTIF